MTSKILPFVFVAILPLLCQIWQIDAVDITTDTHQEDQAVHKQAKHLEHQHLLERMCKFLSDRVLDGKAAERVESPGAYGTADISILHNSHGLACVQELKDKLIWEKYMSFSTRSEDGRVDFQKMDFYSFLGQDPELLELILHGGGLLTELVIYDHQMVYNEKFFGSIVQVHICLK